MSHPRLLPTLIVALTSITAYASEPESCRRVTEKQALLAVEHLRTAGTFVTWCDACAQAPKAPSPTAVREVKARQDGTGWAVVLNGAESELRDTFAKLPDGSMRRVASLVGCEVSATDRVGGAFDDGKLRGELLKPLKESNACDTKPALVKRRVSEQDVAVPLALALTAARHNATGSEADFASSGARYGLSVGFADDFFEDQPVSETAAEEVAGCGGQEGYCIRKRFNLPRRQVTMSFWFPSTELKSCRAQAERIFGTMSASLPRARSTPSSSAPQ